MGRGRAAFWYVILGVLMTSIASAQQQLPTLHNFYLTQRDWAGNIPASDRVWYYTNLDGSPKNAGGGAHPGLEYDASWEPRPGPQVAGVVYVKGATSAQVSVKWRNESGHLFQGWLVLKGARLAVPANTPGTWEYLNLSIQPTQTQYFELNDQEEQSFPITLSGLPQNVALGRIEVKYDLLLEIGGPTLYDNGTSDGFETWEWLYVVDAAPVGLQQVPWIDFLNFSCRWAYGSSGSAVPASMTNGMNKGTRSPDRKLLYSPAQAVYVKYFRGGPVKIDLKAFLNQLNSANTTMNCDDFAGVLRMAMASQGIAGDSLEHRRILPGGATGPFTTGLMVRAGLDDTNQNNYDHDTFNYHMVFSI